MQKKINLGILFGGRSCEHEVSVTSARSMLQAVNKDKYNVTLIGIDKQGHWHLTDEFDALIDNGSVRSSSQQHIEQPSSSSTALSAATDSVFLGLHDQGNLQSAADDTALTEPPALDVIFPVLHGTFGEDGTLQGALEMAGIPYVGCGVSASAVSMDKSITKKILLAEGIPQAPYQVLFAHQWASSGELRIEQIVSELNYPIFVKPANMGSSVGINKAYNREQLIEAIDHALQFDNKVVLEKSMENCREIECAVLGNHEPEASVLGEIIPGADFYNYETKYLDQKSDLVIPANLPESITKEVQSLSIRAFSAVDGAGLSRVDFFVENESNRIFLNEINTMPGFTPISMYPQLWAKSGLPYPDLIDRLVSLAFERHKSKQSLKRAF